MPTFRPTKKSNPDCGKIVVVSYYLDGQLVKSQRGHGRGVRIQVSNTPSTVAYRVDYHRTSEAPRWVCTDSSAGIQQYGRQLAEGVYEFKEKRNGRAFQKTIALADYSPEQVESEVGAYYDSVADLRAMCAKNKDDADWIIAECLFEQSN
jgi:hypothetical protein